MCARVRLCVCVCVCMCVCVCVCVLLFSRVSVFFSILIVYSTFSFDFLQTLLSETQSHD